MTDPEEQLRRLAEGRAEMVEPVTPAEIDRGAEIIEFTPRRWPAAVAAAFLAIVAVSAGLFAVVVGPDGRDRDGGESADVVPDSGTVNTDADDTDDVSAAESGPATTSSTTSVVPDVSIPDVVGETVDDAEEAMREAGLDVELEYRSVEPGDDRMGEVVEVTSEGTRVELVIARLAPSLLSTDPCQRPAHLLGMFDDDLLVDRVFPRFTDGRITEIEICTGAGVRVTATGLDLHRIDLAADIDGDGIDELVASVDADGTATRVLSLVDGALVDTPTTGDIGIALADVDSVPECMIHEPDVAMLGDLDGDGELDAVSPRDGIVCLNGGPVVPLGPAGDEAGVWFLDDIDDDGALEVFIGQTTAESISVQPYSIAADGTITAAAEDDCCVQTTPAGAAALAAADPVADEPEQPARWFSCLAAGPGRDAELVSGRFWVDVESGRVSWTIDVGTEASPDITHEMTFDDPSSTDAWIPGNGCRSRARVWISPATLEFGDDGRATASSVAAFNASIASDDPGRRLVRLREALRVADSLRDAAGPYRESIDEGYFELHGLLDDSVGATRWSFEFSDDGTELLGVTRSWACQPGRGHGDFSTELCI